MCAEIYNNKFQLETPLFWDLSKCITMLAVRCCSPITSVTLSRINITVFNIQSKSNSGKSTHHHFKFTYKIKHLNKQLYDLYTCIYMDSRFFSYRHTIIKRDDFLTNCFYRSEITFWMQNCLRKNASKMYLPFNLYFWFKMFHFLNIVLLPHFS